jgi:hypothetical protein
MMHFDRYSSMTCQKRLFGVFIIYFITPICLASICFSQEGPLTAQAKVPSPIEMTQSFLCEEMKDGRPLNEGLIFSYDAGKITCFTEFDHVAEKTVIYHCWYFKEDLSTKRKLILNPPRWSAFSQIQLREGDKGPWRIDITDQKGNILQTLRFSVID